MNCSSPGPEVDLFSKHELYTRALRATDYKDVCQIYLATFPSMDDDDYSAAWLNRCETSSTVLLQRSFSTADKPLGEPKLIGFGLVSQSPATTAAAAEKKLWFLAVAADHRSGGSGSRLLKAIMATSPSLCLAPVNDEKIIAWYQKNGFEIVQRYPFVHEDIPTCLMARVCAEDSEATSRQSTLTCSEVYSLESTPCSSRKESLGSWDSDFN